MKKTPLRLSFNGLATTLILTGSIAHAQDYAGALTQFANDASTALNNGSASPLPSNSYSYEDYAETTTLKDPPVFLSPTADYSAMAYTDCSGWVNYALNTVSPLHQSVIAGQRLLSEYNQSYGTGTHHKTLAERDLGWSRAFVISEYFDSGYAANTGFTPVTDFSNLQPGDVVAYSTGRWTDPSNSSLTWTGDTGHTFIIVGTPQVIAPSHVDYYGKPGGSPTLDTSKVHQVIAVEIVDSSDITHFNPDNRKNDSNAYELPAYKPEGVPESKLHAGGIGTGTIWLSLDAEGNVLQTRFNYGDDYLPNAANPEVKVTAAARLNDTIELSDDITQDGYLEVRRFENAPDSFAGQDYGDMPVNLTGDGGLRITGDGPIILSGDNSFTGGVIVESGLLVIGSTTGLGAGDLSVQGGKVSLIGPALHDEGLLHLVESLDPGSFELNFLGEDILKTLQIGDDTFTTGTWGAAGSGADNIHAVFSGTGVINLVPEPGHYAGLAGAIALLFALRRRTGLSAK